MAVDVTADRIIDGVSPSASVDRDTFASLLAEEPLPHELVQLVAAPDPDVVRAVVVYLAVAGTVEDGSLLALCLQHEDGEVTRLAEDALWRLWMEAGSAAGNRQLAAAVRCLGNGEVATALHLLERLIDSEPTFAEAHFQRGLALYEQNRLADAADAFGQTLLLNADHFGAAATLGHVHLERGEYGEALDCYQQALQIHPRMADVPEAVHELEQRLARRTG